MHSAKGVVACVMVGALAVPQGALAEQLPADEARAAFSDIVAAMEEERARIEAPSLAVAVADERGMLWSSVATRENAGVTSASAASLYRVGALTEILTSVLVLRLAQSRTLQLDAPVSQYLNGFSPQGPSGPQITLKRLLTHRAGLPAEPATGHYYDSTSSDLSDAVASVSRAQLAFQPGARRSHSRAGVALAGRIAEVAAGKSFGELFTSLVLRDLGMRESTVRLTPTDRARLAYAEIAPIDANPFAAPVYEPGVIPALGLNATIGDLGKLAAAALNDPEWRGELKQVRALHGVADHARTEGFFEGRVREHEYWAFRSRMPGQVAQLTVSESSNLALMTIVALDSAEPSLDRLTKRILERLTADRWRSPGPVRGAPPPEHTVRRVVGSYIYMSGSGHETVTIRALDGRLYLEGPDVFAELRQTPDGAWLLDDARTHRQDVWLSTDAALLKLGSRTYRRGEPGEPAPLPRAQEQLIGEYGWEHFHIRVYERDARLHARIGWNEYVQLDPLAADVYRLGSERENERLLLFTRTAAGEVDSLTVDGVRFPRRDFGREAQALVRAGLSSDLTQILGRARQEQPPATPEARRRPELLPLLQVEPSLKMDLRYASTRNFTGVALYEREAALLQRPAAQALGAAHRALARFGYGIVVHDAYRPWYVTKMFWDAMPEHLRVFVADPARGSRHNRGCAVDVSMFERSTSEIVSMPGEYDEFSARSSPLYLGGTSLQRWRRDLLRQALEAEGFSIYPYEWWHFDFHSWREYPVLNVSLDAEAR